MIQHGHGISGSHFSLKSLFWIVPEVAVGSSSDTVFRILLGQADLDSREKLNTRRKMNEEGRTAVPSGPTGARRFRLRCAAWKVMRPVTWSWMW